MTEETELMLKSLKTDDTLLRKLRAFAIKKGACEHVIKRIIKFYKEENDVGVFQIILGQIGWLKSEGFAPTKEEMKEICTRAKNMGKGYYSSGELWWETPWENEKIHGIEKEYYSSGELWWETPWENEKIHGIEKAYYESGELMWEMPYENGNKHGIEKRYYKSGELWEETHYENGVRVG